MHKIVICEKCLKIISQCRCMDCHKTIIYDICDGCKITIKHLRAKYLHSCGEIIFIEPADGDLIYLNDKYNRIYVCPKCKGSLFISKMTYIGSDVSTENTTFKEKDNV